jgi:hypothetical protein
LVANYMLDILSLVDGARLSGLKISKCFRMSNTLRYDI